MLFHLGIFVEFRLTSWGGIEKKIAPTEKKPLNENEINVDIHVNETVISGWLAGWRTDCLAG